MPRRVARELYREPGLDGLWLTSDDPVYATYTYTPPRPAAPEP